VQGKLSDCALVDMLHTTCLRSRYVQWILCNHSSNLSVPLSDCIIAEQHDIIRFLCSYGVKPLVVNGRMLA